MKKIGLVAKRSQIEKLIPVIKKVYHYLEEHQKEVYLEKPIAELIEPKAKHLFNRGKTKVDLVIVLGGDGTILSVIRSMKEHKAKIFGINMGNLGFLSEIPPEQFEKALDKIFEGKFTIDKRMMLDIDVIRDKKTIQHFSALNEAVIAHSSIARLIKLKTRVNGKKLTDYHADGLIIATPTGSTAYSLSAGGPIIYPTLNTMIITPICPHSFTQKPIVIPDDKIIEIKLENSQKVQLSIDGQESMELKENDQVKIKRNGFAEFIRLPNESFFKTLRVKLDWGKRLEK